MFLPYWFFMFITAMSGLSLGLLISSLATSSKMAANFVPLVLIPQLIFGGALVKYDEMNRDPDLLYTLQRWFALNPDPKQPDTEAREQADRFSTPEHPRYVAGALGPQPKTASISPDVNDPGARNVTFEELRVAYLEQTEALEQLRALWHGVRIHVEDAIEAPAVGVDTPEDLERVRRLLEA